MTGVHRTPLSPKDRLPAAAAARASRGSRGGWERRVGKEGGEGRGGKESRRPTFSWTPRSEEKLRRWLETREGEIKLKPAALPSAAPPSPPRAQARFCSRSDTHNLGINKVRRAVSAALSEAHPCGFLFLCRSAPGGVAGGFFIYLIIFFDLFF